MTAAGLADTTDIYGDPSAPTFEQMIAGLQAEAHALMIERQRKYGPSNIVRPANPLYAVSVRLGDKLARLDHLNAGGVVTADESIDDTLLDISNYGIIGLAVHRRLWRRDYCPPLARP